MRLLLVYGLSVAGGWLITGLAMHVMYSTIGHRQGTRYWLFKWMHLWIGGTERAVATTLLIWAPKLLAGFVAGWVVLKVAANWQRQPGAEFGERHLLALVGSVVSFTVAIVAGLIYRPQALVALTQ